MELVPFTESSARAAMETSPVSERLSLVFQNHLVTIFSQLISCRKMMAFAANIFLSSCYTIKMMIQINELRAGSDDGASKVARARLSSQA